MATKTVKVTLFADPIEVDEEEIPHLRSQGILVEDEPDSTPRGGRGGRSGSNPPPDGTGGTE